MSVRITAEVMLLKQIDEQFSLLLNGHQGRRDLDVEQQRVDDAEWKGDRVERHAPQPESTPSVDGIPSYAIPLLAVRMLQFDLHDFLVA